MMMVMMGNSQVKSDVPAMIIIMIAILILHPPHLEDYDHHTHRRTTSSVDSRKGSAPSTPRRNSTTQHQVNSTSELNKTPMVMI